MSIFNFRRGRPANAKASSKSSSKVAPESVEVVRKRARQRLIGSAVLVLIGVIGFPLLFETQPRPVAVDIPIEIPSRQSVKPTAAVQPVGRAEQSAPAAETVASSSAVAPQASLHDKEEIVEPKPAEPAAAAPAKPEVKAEARHDTKHDAKHEAKQDTKHEAKHDAKADDGHRAKALLEGHGSPAGSVDARHVVQVGAFSDAAKARDARLKLEKAGLKTYTQVTETKDGKRIRVRVGPYATKAEADKAAAKVKSLDLPASILTL